MTWNFSERQVTGTVIFDVNNKTRGTLDYQAGRGMWLRGVVAPGSYQKVDPYTTVFADEITTGSFDYAEAYEGTDYFTVNVIDGSPSGRNGDMIAVVANMDGHGNWLTGPDATTTRGLPDDEGHGRIDPYHIILDPPASAASLFSARGPPG